MAAIVKFDDMYAASLYEEKMLGAVGKILPTEYKNYMGREYERMKKEHIEYHQKHSGEEKNDVEHHHDHDIDLDVIANPRTGHYSLMFLRCVYKIIRIYFVSFNYYFCAFIAIICTIITNEFFH